MSFLPYPAQNTSQAIALIKQDGEILHNVVHGDENADVLTENGLVPSLAKTTKMLVDEVEAATGVDVSLRSDLANVTSTVVIAGTEAADLVAMVNGFTNSSLESANILDYTINPAQEQVASLSQANRVVRYPQPSPSNQFDSLENDFNVYGPTTYRNANWFKIREGTRASPSANKSPTFWVQKIINSDRTVSEFGDNGAIYGAVAKMAGDSFTAGVTGFVDHVGGVGQTIGVHGRANVQTNDGEAFGGWSYASCITPAVTPISLIGHEINIYRNSGTDIGWKRLASSVGNMRGLVITTADGSSIAGTMAIEIGNQQGTSAGWYTGIVNQPGSIKPTNDDVNIGNNEFIRLHGSPFVADRYGGIRIQDGWWQYGISFAEVAWDKYLNGCAILLADRQRIVYGSAPTSGSYTEVTTDKFFNFQGIGGLRISGTQVVGPRVSGFGAVTGALDSSAWTTDGTSLALLNQKVGAIWYALKQHGLI